MERIAFILATWWCITLAAGQQLSAGQSASEGSPPVKSFASPRFVTSPSGSIDNFISQYSGVSVCLRGVDFSDALTGTVVGDSGTILRTTNGGISWRPQSSGVTGNLTAIGWISNSRGIVAGERGIVLVTTNGGATWAKKTSGTTENLHAVAFSRTETAFTVGDSGIILRSTNNGTSWTKQMQSGISTPLMSIAFADADTGMIVGWNGVMLRTIDGGDSWTKQTLYGNMQLGGVAFRNGHDVVASVMLLPNVAYQNSIVTEEVVGGWDLTQILFRGTAKWDERTNSISSSSNGTIHSTFTNYSWISPDRGTTGQGYLTPSRIYDVSTIEEDIFTMVGENGLIERTADPRWPALKVGLLSPAEDTTNLDLMLNAITLGSCLFSWHGMGEVPQTNLTYYLEICEDLLFAHPVYSSDAIVETTATAGLLKMGVTYFWRVRAQREGWQSEWSDTRRFSTRPLRNGMQQLAQPPNGVEQQLDIAMDGSYGTSFVWFPYPDFIFSDGTHERPLYRVQVSTDSSFKAGGDVWTSEGEDTITNSTGLHTHQTYYWRVQPFYSVGNAEWSVPETFTTAESPRSYSPFERLSPVNGSIFTMKISLHTYPFHPALQFQWSPYPDKVQPDNSIEQARYFFQLGTDSTFIVNHPEDYNVYLPDSNSQGVVIDTLKPFRTYYWRMRTGYSPYGGTPWSDIWSFTTDVAMKTVQQIQQVDSGLLLRADSLHWSGLPFQFSRCNDSLVAVVARCVVAPGVLTKEGPTMIIADTGSGSQEWGSVLVQTGVGGESFELYGMSLDEYYHLNASFSEIRQGDLLRITGFVTERGYTNTTMECLKFSVLGSAPAPIVSYRVAVTDFVHGDSMRFSTGERYEGSIVEMHDLSVHSILDAGLGTFDLIDSDGNLMRMSDQSGWFTRAAHRNLYSTYAPPHPGSHINMIRGVIISGGEAFCIAPIFPADLEISPDSHRIIHGHIYQTTGCKNSSNPLGCPFSGFQMHLSGKAIMDIWTDSSGYYTFPGVDSGEYILTPKPPDPWRLALGGPYPVTVHFGAADEDSFNYNFSYSRPCAHISGTVYEDLNENGIREYDEPGVGGVPVRLFGSINDSTMTNGGNFSFDCVGEGWNALAVFAPEGWEQIHPYWFDSLGTMVESSTGTYTGRDFALHRIPARTKLRLRVHDNAYTKVQSLSCGARGGASYGIWASSPSTTVIDYSEGEFDLPPASMAQNMQFFDARFQDPQGNNLRFGEGSWTDMRNFSSPAQVDSYRVTFLPGYIERGDYPMTVCWDRDQVTASYSGQVSMVDPLGTAIDMKAADSVIITDRRIGSVLIITHGPNLPLSARWGWSLVSTPGTTSDDRIIHLYTFASRDAFYYDKELGYQTSNGLWPRRGYWLKCLLNTRQERSLLTTLTLPETLTVHSGWNLIGAPFTALDAGDVQADPPEIILSGIFCYRDGRYQLADSLHPYEGYWIKANESGRIILGDNSTGETAGKKSATEDMKTLIDHAVTISLVDATGIPQRLYIAPTDVAGNSEQALMKYEMPPLPPSGIGDIRFASGRCLELLPPAGMVKEYPIALSSDVVYPVTITYHVPEGTKIGALFLTTGKATIPLKENTPVRVSSRTAMLSLRVQGGQSADLPKGYRLEQNYPNPFNPQTTIQYALPVESKVRLSVYDVLGREVAELIDQVQNAGYQSIVWDATNASSGVYFYRLDAVGAKSEGRSFTQVRKLVIVK